MRFYRNGYREESSRLKAIQRAVFRSAPHFGINKQREITRLLYEVSKREKIPIAKIVLNIPFDSYKITKKILLARRFSEALRDQEELRPFLPDFSFSRASVVDLNSPAFSPKRIFVEETVAASALAARFKKKFPHARHKIIPLLKDYQEARQMQGVRDYNKRRESVFIVEQKNDYFKPCPCTKGARGCGYYVFNCGFGCIFECTYCFLQQYTNTPGIILPANLDAYFDALAHSQQRNLRIGTGEFSDSLALDDVTCYSHAIIDFFKKYPQSTFEFKTKSTNIDNLLCIKTGGNIVVSWSLNTQKMIDQNEFSTPSLSKRLQTARRCVEAGFRIGFHFDPLIFYPEWHKDYENVVTRIFDNVRPSSIAWISLGTFRCAPALKPILEARFPANTILDEELFLGYDGKLRYGVKRRLQMYNHVWTQIRKFSKKTWVYLCMEDEAMHKALRIENG